MSKESETKNDKPKFTFYLNMHVLDKKQVIKTGVAQSSVPKFMTSFTTSLATSVVSDEMIINEITGEILKEFPGEMKKLGVMTRFEQVFTKSTLAVLKCELMSIDIPVALAAEKGEEAKKHWDNMIAAFKFFEMSDEEISSTVTEMEVDLMKEMPGEISNELKTEFKKNEIDVNVECKTEEEEATFLFDYMKTHLK